MLATPPPPPAGVPPQATIGSPLLQAGQTPQGILGGGLQDPKALLDIPSILGTPPAPTAWNNQYMLPQYETPSAPGSNTPMAGIPEGQELENTNMRGLLKRIHGQYKEGNLQGGFLGQRPEESLGQPLEGTAPPPGTNLPAGLEQFQPPPPDPAMAPPPPPGAPPVPLPPGAPLPPG